MLKTVLAVMIILFATGCQLTGGQAAYELEPIMSKDGSIVSYKVSINNTKDYENLDFSLKRSPDGTIEARLKEKGVNSSDPAAVAAANNTKLLEVLNKVIPTSN